MEEVGFDLTGMAWNEEICFGLTPDLNVLNWQMSVLAVWFP
jgi:hypothetical protein